MKSKFTYAMLLLLCCTLGASSNRNMTGCDALERPGSSGLPTEEAGAAKPEAEAASAPQVTGYLPGLNIIFSN